MTSILPRYYTQINVQSDHIIKDGRGKEIKVGDYVAYTTAGRKSIYSSPQFGIITVAEHAVYTPPTGYINRTPNKIHTFLKFDNTRIIRESTDILKLEQ